MREKRPDRRARRLRRGPRPRLRDDDLRARSWREAWERDPWATQGGWIVVLAEAGKTVGVFVEAVEVAVRRFLREVRR